MNWAVELKYIYRRVFNILKHGHEKKSFNFFKKKLLNYRIHFIIKKASLLAAGGDYLSATKVLEKSRSERVRVSAYLFKASMNYTKDTLWLDYINKYLRFFSVKEVCFNNSSKTKFFRLRGTECATEYDCDLPLVTVLMTTYNSEETVEYAINSILNQTWKNLELIIIDDCSSDKTWDILQRFVALDERVTAYKNTSNLGTYVSKNLALLHAKGSYITCHDSDDWAHPKRLEEHLTIMLEKPEAKVSVSKAIRFDSMGKFEHAILSMAPISCVFEKDFMSKKLGYWDSVRFGADTEMIGRATKILKDDFITIDKPLLFVMDRAGSLTKNNTFAWSPLEGGNRLRIIYHDNANNWKKNVSSDDELFLNFPLKERPFEIPKESTTDYNSVERAFIEHFNSIQETESKHNFKKTLPDVGN